MNRHSILAWSYLHVLTKRRYEAVLEVFGTLEQALAMIGEEFLKQLGVKESTIRDTLMRLEEFDSDRYERELTKAGVQITTIEDPAYPPLLRQAEDAPVFLHSIGDLSILTQPCIGVVGTRGMTQYGKRVTGHFVPSFVRAGMVTVSGLALGVDTRVAHETLLAGGRTVAVLGHGLSTIFPASNEELAGDIVKKGGLLLSEYPLSMESSKHTFPARNRIIAGVSLGTLVIEAPAKSGALITAELALDYNREVFAVPGQIFDPNSEGCNALIAAGRAQPVSQPEEVLRVLGIIAPAKEVLSTYEPKTDDERAVWAVLTTMPKPVDDIVEASGLPAAGVNVTLTMLELAGVVKNTGGGMWVRA